MNGAGDDQHQVKEIIVQGGLTAVEDSSQQEFLDLSSLEDDDDDSQEDCDFPYTSDNDWA